MNGLGQILIAAFLIALVAYGLIARPEGHTAALSIRQTSERIQENAAREIRRIKQAVP